MSDLEQKIRKAAEKAPQQWFIQEDGVISTLAETREYASLVSPANILALLAEKDAEIERLRGLVVHGDGSCDRCGEVPAIVMPTSLCDECIEGIKRAESSERERDEWKKIAGQYRAEHAEWGCITSGNDVCDTCKAYDVLAGKGE